MTKAIFPLFILFAAGICTAQTAGNNYEFSNGNWYNGDNFEPATWYSVNGKLTKKAPEKIDSTIDLTGRWVVPPLGDAFCSSVSENPMAENQLKSYLDEGIFYLQTLGNTQEGRKRTARLLPKASAPEIAFANGGFTCTMGYPFLNYEGPANGVRNPQLNAEKYGELKTSRKMQGDGYWFVDSKSTLQDIWKRVMEQKPDVISIYLLDADNNGGKETKGLTPAVAKAIVKKAQRAKIPVFAHVETAADLRLGIKIGVQGFANLPGHNWDGSGDGAKYQLSDQDLKMLAKKKTAVVPLFSHAQTKSSRPGALEEQAQLFKRLLSHGVNIVAGSDDSQRTLRSEINYWFQFGGLNYGQALKILCVNTPQAIFPGRKIGKLAEGYEANFLVLSDNPLTNILKLRAIAFMVHHGKLVK